MLSAFHVLLFLLMWWTIDFVYVFSLISSIFFFRCDNKGIVNKFFVVNWEQVNQTSVDFLPILLLAIADKMTFELFFLTWIPNNVRIFLGMQSFNKIKNKNGGVKIQLRFEGIKLNKVKSRKNIKSHPETKPVKNTLKISTKNLKHFLSCNASWHRDG